MVEARNGETWAVEFARFSALGTVVRDDGSGLGKGLKLERARRRVEGRCDDLEDMLDIFHTFREGGRALRKTRRSWSNWAVRESRDPVMRPRSAVCGVRPSGSGIRR